MNHIFHIILFSSLLLLVSCGDRTPVVELHPENSELVKENMINANPPRVLSSTPTPRATAPPSSPTIRSESPTASKVWTELPSTPIR